MGLEDRDYMRERRNDEYFARGTREAAASRTIWTVAIVVGLAYGGYTAWKWWESHAGRPAANVTTVAPPAARPLGLPQNVPSVAIQRRPPSPDHGQRTVIKCVANGSTSYVETEAECAAPSRAVAITIDPQQNLADGIRVPKTAAAVAAPPAPSPAPVAQAQIPAAPDAAQKQALCQAYDEEIKQIDARARQPLYAAEQDWLTAKRRKARDEQFRLRCQ